MKTTILISLFSFISLNVFADSIPLSVPGKFQLSDTYHGENRRTTTIEVPSTCYSRDPYCTDVLGNCTSTPYICSEKREIHLGTDYFQDRAYVDVTVLPSPAGLALKGSLVSSFDSSLPQFKVLDSGNLLYELQINKLSQNYSGGQFRFISQFSVVVKSHLLENVQKSAQIKNLVVENKTLSFETFASDLGLAVNLKILKKAFFRKKVIFGGHVDPKNVEVISTPGGLKYKIKLDSLVEGGLPRGQYTISISKVLPEVYGSRMFFASEKELGEEETVVIGL